MVLLSALLIWNLIEHTLRQYVKEHQQTLPGWDNKPTMRPTTFMMSTKFSGLQVVKLGQLRRFAKPLTKVQQIYLKALGITEHYMINHSERLQCLH